MKPNVLVIMCDQMKATASHLYGSPFCETPSMARLAAEGVLFRNAITPHPLCVPARISFWTSQWPHSHGGRRNRTLMPPNMTHAFRLWKAEGFHTGLIGKNHCFQDGADLALFDTWCEITHCGFPEKARPTKGMAWFRTREQVDAAHAVRRRMPDISPRFSYAVSDFPLEDYSTGLVAGQTVRFLEQHRDDPFALWVSFPDPHTPYEVPRRYAEMIPRQAVTLPPWRKDEFTDGTAPERNRILAHMLGVADDPPEHVRGMVATYHASTRFVDDGVGQILEALDRTALRERTIVVFCSDHGDFAGEHAMVTKGGAFYDCLTRVPLIVSWRGHVSEGLVDESMVNLIDVMPTLLCLQGMPSEASMHGRPLPTVTEEPGRDVTFSEYGAGGPAFRMSDLMKLEQPFGRKTVMTSIRWREAEGRRKMVRTRDWKYVHDPEGDEDELYDLRNDPWELQNIARDPKSKERVEDMRLRLADWSIRTEDARPVPLP